MILRGRLHEISNLSSFVASYLKTGGRPTTGFAPMGKTRVHLATDFPSKKFAGGFPPSMSMKTDSNSDGKFSFDVEKPLKGFRGQIVVFRQSEMPNPIKGMPPIPVFDPIYRCAPFAINDIASADWAAAKNIYIHRAKTPDDKGITQKEIDELVKDLRKDLKLDKLRATILSNRAAVTAEKKGGDVKFSAFVRGSTSADLDRVITVKAGEIDIDLPGPDFIVGLCVDEDQIEAQIRKGLVNLSKRVSTELLEELEKAAPGLSSKASVSVWRVRFVKVGERMVKMPGLPKIVTPIYSVVPDAAFGVPRKLF